MRFGTKFESYTMRIDDPTICLHDCQLPVALSRVSLSVSCISVSLSLLRSEDEAEEEGVIVVCEAEDETRSWLGAPDEAAVAVSEAASVPLAGRDGHGR